MASCFGLKFCKVTFGSYLIIPISDAILIVSTGLKHRNLD